jgi:DNA-binding LacI/PurR family transcriptional regulator
MDDGGRVSIRDVARAAGVSTTTVSDALSGGGRLSQATRDRVARVAEELGYAAHPNARWLRSGRTGAIGLHVPDQTVGLEYYMRLALGAADEAFAHGMALTLVPGARLGQAGPPLHLDGAVVSDPVLESPTLARLSSLGIPVVTCERDVTPGAEHAGRVEADHHAGIQTLLDHLHEQGARRIAVLTPGPETSYGIDIRAGHEQWCRRVGLPALVYDVPFASTAPEVHRAVDAALGAPGRPEAIVAVPDGSLMPCLHALQRAGVAYPRDLLLASYVDSLGLSALPVPVTAVDLIPAEMGRTATRVLAEIVEGRRAPGAVVRLPTHLRVRASTQR